MHVAEVVRRNALSDLSAERNTLACLCKTEEAWMRLPSGFAAEDFTEPLNQALFVTIDRIYAEGGKVDAIGVSERLPSDMQAELREIGDWGYIQALKDLPIDPLNVNIETKKLQELSQRRRIEKAGGAITDIAKVPEPLESLMEKVEVTVGEIEGDNESEVIQLGDQALDWVTSKMVDPKDVPGISTGFTELDLAIQGFQPGRMYVVGGRKKEGKSMCLLNWATHVAVNNKIPVLWISTEHTWADELSRILSRISDVREELIQNGKFSEVELQSERVADAVDILRKSPFYFCYLPNINLTRIKRLARKHVRVNGIKALFVDYLKNPEGEANSKEWQELGVLAYGLKALAGKENIPVISAVQINREGAAEFRVSGEIDSDHFGGSDRIAQAVSVAMVIRHPNKQEVKDDIDQFRVLRVTDNRHGSSGQKLLLNFRGEVIKMEELRRI